MAEELTIYDYEEVYKTEIMPLVQEIRKVCRLKKLPFACVFATKNDENGTVYRKEGEMTGSMGVNLKDDHFTRFLLALCGDNVKVTIVDPSKNPADDVISDYYEIFDEDEE